MAIIFSSKNYRASGKGWRYKDFSQGMVWVANYDKPVKVDLIRLEENNRVCWQKATSSKECDCRIYEVVLSEDDDIDLAIENLKYFFIRADRARENNGEKKPQVGLLIHASSQNIYRLQAYFSMQAWSNPRYNLLYSATEDTEKENPEKPDREQLCHPFLPPDKVEPKHRSPVGRIMPLLRVVAHGTELSAGDVDIAALICTEKRTETSQSGIKIPDEDVREYCENEHNTYDLRWWESLQNLCRVFLVRMSQGIIGKPGNPFTQADKLRIRRNLSSFIISKREHMSFLGELCWFFNMQYLMEEKQLLNTNKELNMVILQQSYLDAITYTDGILQLLENSCQYSQRHSAYLSLRMHHVDREGTDAQLIKTMRSREKLIKRYTMISNKPWELEKNAKNYIEIGITDDAFVSNKTRCGILETYRKNAIRRYQTEEENLPKTLKDIFLDGPLPMASTNEGIIHHYGIPALKQVVLQNHGGFLVSSPYIQETELVQITQGGEYRIERKQLDETSEYHILFPLGLVEPKINTQQLNDWQSLFEMDGLKDIKKSNVVTRVFNIKKDIEALNFEELFLDQDDKKTRVQDAIKEFVKKQSEISRLDNCIQMFDLRGVNGLQLELFAKFLFRTILDAEGDKRLYAVYFDDYLKEQELIRLFSIFYHRVRPEDVNGGRNLGAQIALCSTHPELNVPEVNLILNVKDWNTLLESARRFAYCNLESAQNVYSQIKYLARDNLNQSTGLPVFPFDLYLCEAMGTTGEGSAQPQNFKNNTCWFLQRITKLLERDLQQERMGIQVKDIHAYLSSNVHLGSFYEAEQLFHNVAYVYRFAYLMALRLLRSGYTGKNYMIICYEAYSKLIVQYLADYLTEALGEGTHVEHATMYQEKKGHPQLIIPPSLLHDPEREKFYGTCNYITLCPIGTTLSTIHTMHDCIVQETKMALRSDNMRDMVIILVAEDAEPTKIQHRYWRSYNGEGSDAMGNPSRQQKERVKLYSRYSESEWNVDYFLMAKTAWHDPEDCADFQGERALVHADSTSTELNMVFPLKEQVTSAQKADSGEADWNRIHRHDVCSLIKYKDVEKNNNRLKLLEDCVYYGHICRGSNHYGFCLNLPYYYQRIKHERGTGLALKNDHSYTAWLKDLHKLKINKDAFNIIVTPLRNGNSPLLKDLVDHVFEHSIHILQLDLHNTRRTDVRTKYSYIAKECAEVQRNDPNARINVYYVDDSVVSAETLQRGRSLIQMLLWECLSQSRESFLFTGVFVLVNRSSRDTIQTFVKNPDTDFHAFVHLAVPHYNTRNNHCPACDQVEKYYRLKMRSTTNRFAEEYQRLSEKHKLRTVEEYICWQKEQFMCSPGAYLRLRQWMFNQGTAKEQKSPEIKKVGKLLEVLKERFCEEFCRDQRIPFERSTSSCDEILVDELLDSKTLQQRFLTALSQVSLRDLLTAREKKDIALCEALQKVWFRHVLRDKADKRLMSAHRAYCVLPLEIELDVPDDSGGQNSFREMYNRILDYLTPGSEYKSEIACWEYILSGLKVVSRDYLARHHLVREAIFHILHCVADIMQGKVSEEERIQQLLCVENGFTEIPAMDNKVVHAIDPLLRYQMFYSVLRRLSDMESNYAILALSDGLLLKKLEMLTDTFFRRYGTRAETMNRWYFCTIPSYRQMVFDYEKCIKLATMSDDEENKSMLIQMEHRHLSDNGTFDYTKE